MKIHVLNVYIYKKTICIYIYKYIRNTFQEPKDKRKKQQ